MIKKTTVQAISMRDNSAGGPRCVTLFITVRKANATQVALRFMRTSCAEASGAVGIAAIGQTEKEVDGEQVKKATAEILHLLNEYAAGLVLAKPEDQAQLTEDFTDEFRTQAAAYTDLIVPPEVSAYLENEIASCGAKIVSLVIDTDPSTALDAIPWELIHLGMGLHSFFLPERALVVRALVVGFADKPALGAGVPPTGGTGSCKPAILLAPPDLAASASYAVLHSLGCHALCDVRPVSRPRELTSDLGGRGLVIVLAHHDEQGVPIGKGHWTGAQCRVSPFPSECVLLLLACRAGTPSAGNDHFLSRRASLCADIHRHSRCTVLAPLALLPLPAALDIVGHATTRLAGQCVPLWQAWPEIVRARSTFLPIAFVAHGQWDHVLEV